MRTLAHAHARAGPAMARYQDVRLEDITVKRTLFGVFPTYRDSPLKPAFDRVLQVRRTCRSGCVHTRRRITTRAMRAHVPSFRFPLQVGDASGVQVRGRCWLSVAHTAAACRSLHLHPFNLRGVCARAVAAVLWRLWRADEAPGAPDGCRARGAASGGGGRGVTIAHPRVQPRPVVQLDAAAGNVGAGGRRAAAQHAHQQDAG